jgi:pimeloyl-ACP methyl ester carboxylesterase
MSSYVLVHGAWHGGWCWDKVLPLLRRAGHGAVAPDLPGYGSDTTPMSGVTLAAYVKRVREVIEAQAEPVILVGHSMAGVVIAQMAEICPDKIECLVFLCAFLPANGECLADWSRRDIECVRPSMRVVAEDKSYTTLRPEALKEVFYADCFDRDVERARQLLRPQATAPVNTPVVTTAENFGRVRRIYIETLRDRAVSNSLQRQMYSAVPCERVISMDTSHSPFFSAPETLVAHLTSL